MIKGKAFRTALERIKHGEMHSEKQFNPTVIDYRLRASLWHEYSKTLCPVDAKNVYKGICTYTHWHVGVLNNPKKLSWMLEPKKDLITMLKPSIDRIVDRCNEIIFSKYFDENNEITIEILKSLNMNLLILERLITNEKQ